MAIDVYLIRHAESTGNATGERAYDPELTARGRRQAARLAAALAACRLTLVVCSPLLRALATAAPIAAAAGCPLCAWNDLVEWNRWDAYRSQAREVLARLFPEAGLEREMPAGGWIYPRAEPRERAAVGARRVAARTSALPPGSRVALVGHGNINGLLLRAWLAAGAPGAGFGQDNACVSVLRLEAARVTVRSLNDTGHLLWS